MVSRKKSCDNKISLISFIKNLTDLRREQGKRHKLYVVVIIAIMAIMNQYTSFRGFEIYAQRNKTPLFKIFKLEKKRLPKKDTFREVFKKLDFEELDYIFKKYYECNNISTENIWISIDGKSIRNTMPEHLTKCVSMISFFTHDTKQVILQGKVDSKNFETNLTKKHLDYFENKKVIFTADALYTEKKMISQIQKSNNYYVFPVKHNRPSLHKKVSFLAEKSISISTDKTIEKNRGRHETREVKVFENDFNYELEELNWKHITRIIRVERTIFFSKNNKTTNEVVYYISNLNLNAKQFNIGIRNHWSIENSLHWVKDSILNEDKSCVKGEKTASVFSIFRNLSLNIIRYAGFKSIINGIRILMCDIKKMWKLLGGEN